MAEAVRGMMRVAGESKRDEHERERAQHGSRHHAAPRGAPPAACVTGRIDRRQRVGFHLAWMHGHQTFRLAALLRGNIIPAVGSRIDLPGTADFLLWVLDHFLPLRNPAHGAGEREQGGEHIGRETERL